jgi:hypothetical protein
MASEYARSGPAAFRGVHSLMSMGRILAQEILAQDLPTRIFHDGNRTWRAARLHGYRGRAELASTSVRTDAATESAFRCIGLADLSSRPHGAQHIALDDIYGRSNREAGGLAPEMPQLADKVVMVRLRPMLHTHPRRQRILGNLSPLWAPITI